MECLISPDSGGVSSSDTKDLKGLKLKWVSWMFPGTPQLSCNAAGRCLITSLTSLHKKCDIGPWRQDDKAPNDVMEFSVSNSANWVHDL